MTIRQNMKRLAVALALLAVTPVHMQAALALAMAIVTAVPPTGATLVCRAWISSRAHDHAPWIRQSVACQVLNEPAVFKVPAFMLPDPGPDQVLSFCVSAVTAAGESACVGPDQINVAPAPPRGPFVPVPQ